MSWGEVFKINSDMDMALNIRHMISTLTDQINDKSVSKVMSAEKYVGLAFDEAFDIGNTTLAGLDTWAEILASSTAMTAIIADVEAVKLLLNCSYTVNDVMNNDTYWGAIISDYDIFNECVQDWKVRYYLTSNAKALNRLVKNTTAKQVWHDNQYAWYEFRDDMIALLDVSTTYFTKTAVNGTAVAPSVTIGTSYSFVNVKTLVPEGATEIDALNESYDNQVSWVSMGVECSYDYTYNMKIICCGGANILFDVTNSSSSYTSDKYEAL